MRKVHADPGGRHDRRPVCIEAGFGHSIPPRVAGLEVDRHKPQEGRDAETEVDEALPFPRLRAGPVDLKYEQASGEFAPTLRKCIQTGSEDDVLPDAASHLLRDEIFDEASA